jgi:hypothetical protein
MKEAYWSGLQGLFQICAPSLIHLLLTHLMPGISSVTDPGSGAFLTPGSGIRDG